MKRILKIAVVVWGGLVALDVILLIMGMIFFMDSSGRIPEPLGLYPKRR